jgi:hypothetical protein
MNNGAPEPGVILFCDIETEERYEDLDGYAAQYGYRITGSVGFSPESLRGKTLEHLPELDQLFRNVDKDNRFVWLPYESNLRDSGNVVLLAYALNSIGVTLLVDFDLHPWAPDEATAVVLFTLQSARNVTAVLHSSVVRGLLAVEIEQLARSQICQDEAAQGETS